MYLSVLILQFECLPTRLRAPWGQGLGQIYLWSLGPSPGVAQRCMEWNRIKRLFQCWVAALQVLYKASWKLVVEWESLQGGHACLGCWPGLAWPALRAVPVVTCSGLGLHGGLHREMGSCCSVWNVTCHAFFSPLRLRPEKCLIVSWTHLHCSLHWPHLAAEAIC